MKPPNSKIEVRQFIGVVIYNYNMSEIGLHMLAPLTNITPSKVKFKWTKIKQDALDKTMRIMACHTLLAYPDFNEELKIHNDATKSQLGEVVR